MKSQRPRVVIIGGGFGGLAAAKTLKDAPVDVILIDRSNHHLFQPLLYQVATSVLSSSQIAAPLRNILRKQKNAIVILGEVTGVDRVKKQVFSRNVDREGVAVSYDYLIIATGAHNSYLGHDDFERFAPGLKTLADAVGLRNRILEAFERAEAKENPHLDDGLLTFVLIGAGPTGVEMAGAISVLVQQTLRSEFRRMDPALVRIVLISSGDRVLATFSEPLSTAAKHRLERLGVEIRTGRVARVDETGAWIGGEVIPSRTVIWTAGVTAFPVGHWFEGEADHGGRVRVDGQLRAAGSTNVFVIGDAASYSQDGKPLPGVAQVALQQGRYAGRLIRNLVAGKPEPPPFRYFDKGNMAVVGKGFAILESGKFQLSGRPAWAAWAAIHLQFLATSGLRMSVFLEWMWNYFTWQRGSRLIENPPQPVRPETPKTNSANT